MKYKSLFLYIYFLISFASCTVAHSNNTLRNVPNKEFVKVFKTLEVTKCLKNKLESSTDTCRTANFGSTGSGVYIDIIKDRVIVLTAGHVCDNSMKIPKENENYTFHVNSKIFIQNHKGKFYNAKIILSEHSSIGSGDKADLCSLTIQQNKKSRGLRLASSPPRRGEDVYYMGAPMGIYHPPTVLIIKGVFSGKINDISSLISAPAAPGSSGSTVLSYGNRIWRMFAVHQAFNSIHYNKL